MIAVIGLLSIVALAGLGQRRGFRSGPAESLPQANSEAEKRVLAVLEEAQRNGATFSNVPASDGRMLRLLAEAAGAKNVVEIGTSHGYSAIWMCLALRHTGGRINCFEIDKDRAERARQNFKRAGVDSLVTLVEGDAHQEVLKLKGPIDLLFLDADKEGYLDYLNKLLPQVRGGGLIVAHNMTARQADAKFVEAIGTNTSLDTIYLTWSLEGRRRFETGLPFVVN